MHKLPCLLQIQPLGPFNCLTPTPSNPDSLIDHHGTAEAHLSHSCAERREGEIGREILLSGEQTGAANQASGNAQPGAQFTSQCAAATKQQAAAVLPTRSFLTPSVVKAYLLNRGRSVLTLLLSGAVKGRLVMRTGLRLH